MNEQTKAWETPQLIILARGTPEENVLLNCKTMNPNDPYEGAKYQISQSTCGEYPTGNCATCQSRGQGVS